MFVFVTVYMKIIDFEHANRICNRVKTKTVRLIETVQLNVWKALSRSYGTFNRVIKENFGTVRLIETVLIIESLEYSTLFESLKVEYV